MADQPPDASGAPATDERTPPPLTWVRELLAAQRLGHFRLIERIGQGGMGQVWRAEDTTLGRPVAVKVMHPDLAGQPAARERFLREARAAGRLHHDHIVPIFEAGEEDGRVYLAMPLLAGEPLDARLQREGRLSRAEAVRIARETALGLQAAHEA